MNVNLFPAEFQARGSARKLKRGWMCACGATLVAATLALATQYAADVPLRIRVAERRARHAALHDTVTACSKLESDAVALADEITRLRKLHDDSRALILLGTISAKTRDCQGGVRLARFEAQLAASEGTDGDASTAVVDAVGADPASIATFVAGLRDAGLFERVELKGSGEPDAAREGGRRFQVECRF